MEVTDTPGVSYDMGQVADLEIEIALENAALHWEACEEEFRIVDDQFLMVLGGDSTSDTVSMAEWDQVSIPALNLTLTLLE